MLWLCLLAGLAAEPIDYIEIFVAQAPEREVFLTNTERDEVRARRDTEAWARSAGAWLEKQAEALCAEKLLIPHTEGQWTHWYNCPKDGAPLRPRESGDHECTLCAAVYNTKKYDQAYFALRHRYWADAVEKLGWAYALDPKPAYAGRVRAILVEYASFYQTLPVHDRDGGKTKSPGRLHAQSLEEAMTLCQFCVGYDRTYHDACYSDADHEAIETALIRPMVEIITPHAHGGSNWQAWQNAAVGCAGFLLRDDELVEWAVNGPDGFVQQMNKNVLPSGMWFEESLTYHWFALRGFIYLMEAAVRAGVDLYAHPSVKKMFDAPLQLLFPDLTFPAINDSDRTSIRDMRAVYEVAFRRFGGPRYAALLDPRNTEWALFWGAARAPDATAPDLHLESANLQHMGLAVLRDPARDTALYVDYGGFGGNHTHPARLGLVLYAQGDERFVDPGRLPYGNPLHTGWYKETVAHNTVVIGRKSQALGQARLSAFSNVDGTALVRVVSDTAYDSAILDRTLVMRGNLILDVVQCHASQETVVDLPLHLRGALTGLPPSEPCEPLGDNAGYNLLQAVTKFVEPLKSLNLDTGGGKGIQITFHDAGGETFLANGFGATPQELLPVVIRRKTARDAVFVSAYTLYDGTPPPQPELAIEQTNALLVHAGDWTLELSGDTAIQENAQKTYYGPDGAISTRPI